MNSFGFRTLMATRVLAVLVLASLVVPQCFGGTFSTVFFTDDATSGISDSNTYTHKVDLNGGGSLVINNVTFDNGPQGSKPLSYSVTNFGAGGSSHDSGISNTQATYELLSDFYYDGSSNGTETLTLHNLLPGATYKTVFYVSRNYGDNLQDLSINDTAVPTSITSVPRSGGAPLGSAARLEYTYTLADPQTSVTFTFDAASNTDTFHQYGFTNQVVTPLSGYVPLPGLSNTGVTNPNNFDGTNGTQIAALGTIDPNWDVDLPTAGFSLVDARVANNQGAYYNGGGNSTFVNDLGDAGAGSAPGTYTYQTTFNIAGNVNLSSVILMGTVYVDDNLTDILINGQSTGFISNGFDQSSGTPFTLANNFFTAGANILSFLVVNGGTDPNPTGLRVDLLRAIALVPEPTSLTLLGMGLATLVLRRRK